MKLLHSNPDGYVFRLRQAEKDLIFRLLQLYPVVPAAHHRLSQSGTGDADDENQRLLDESLAAHRQEQQAQVLAMMEDPACFSKVKGGWQLRLSGPQIEGLLQVFNDIRVGSWIALGSPDFEQGVKLEPTEVNAARIWLMETAGFFQQQLLEAVGEG